MKKNNHEEQTRGRMPAAQIRDHRPPMLKLSAYAQKEMILFHKNGRQYKIGFEIS
jgi:hypothetical protein